MHYLPIVAVFKAQADLSEYAQDFLFRETPSNFDLLCDLVSQVARIGKLHHNIQVHLFVLVDVFELNHIGMVQALQYSWLL